MALKDCNIVLIGAGIGGLTAAIALQRAGFPVSIYERADELTEIGAGLTLAKNASKALRSLGLADKMDAYGFRPQSGGGKYLATGEIHRRSSVPGDIRQERGETDPDARFRMFHRADLHQMLMKTVLENDSQAIHLDHCFQSLEQNADEVTVHFDNGKSVRGDIVIGCDGNRSGVRQTIFDDDKVEFLGYVAWRGIISIDSLPPGTIDTDSSLFSGDHHSLLRYKIRDGNTLNVVAYAKKSDWVEEGWSVPAEKSELKQEFTGAAHEVQLLLDAIPADECFKWGLFGREPMKTWTVGRVSLLGDATLPMLPFLGQGAGMAIEDSVVLARCLTASETAEEALRRYEAARRERTSLVTIGARYNGLRMHGTIEKALEERAKEYDSVAIHEYDAATVAV